MERLCLSENAIHLWHTPAPRELDPERAGRYLNLLAPEEQRRYHRYKQSKDRCQFLLGKVLVRTLLSHYFSRAPEEWAFAANRFGKPELAGGTLEQKLHFNLAHTDGLVVCVLARDFEVGVDVESRTRTVNLDIARRFFAPAEVAFLEHQGSSAQPGAFFKFWTLKEAYVKARGQGLSLPLEQFAFRIEDGRPPAIAFDPAMNDDERLWQFFLPEVPSPDHQIAIAAHTGQDRNVEVTVRELAL
jgi:4'-phosphopantetheinyl transferase